MKKFLISLLSLFLVSSMGFAQERVTIHFADGTSVTKYAWEIDQITFDEDNEKLQPQKPEAAIDLGLSIKWAPFNIGATSETEVGYLVGWGDASGKIKSNNNKYFPSTVPPLKIVNTEFDIAKNLWGDEWRLPTVDEIKELMACEHEIVPEGIKFYSEDKSQFILLPFVSNEEGVANGAYWSGILSEDSESASALAIGEEMDIVPMLRYMALAVRPVYGVYKAGVEVSMDEPTDITTTSGTFKITFNGDVAEISECGICYSAAPIASADISYGTKKVLDISSAEETTSLLLNETISGFDFHQDYYVFAYAVVDGIYSYSAVKHFKTASNYPVPADDEAIDLGLGVKWAPFNIGASRVGDYGGLYGWGDATGELVATYEKYGTETVIPNIANTKYDMAHVQWKSKWRMPTEKEMKELYDNCTQKYISNYEGTGVCGYEFTGPNGNKLFIPYAGYREGSTPAWYKTTACFWTADASDHGLPTAVYFRDYQYLAEIATYMHRGLSIRPVFGKYNPNWSDGEQQDPDPSGKDEGDGDGDNGNDEKDDPNPPTPETPLAGKAVDLGLPSGTKWADVNVGATSENIYGKFFTWGELNEQTAYYRANYNYFDKSTKNTFYNIGLDLAGNVAYDVAAKEWGGKWRMPTYEQINELVENCTFEYSFQSGSSGYKVTGPNKNSIFIPAAGYKYDNEHYGQYDGVATIWSSTLYQLVVGSHSTDKDWAYMMTIASDARAVVMADYRYFGRPVRPVCK